MEVLGPMMRRCAGSLVIIASTLAFTATAPAQNVLNSPEIAPVQP